jgi:hypothetical protein
MAGKGPSFRLKAKRKDGSTIQAKDRDGNQVKLPRAEIGVVWDNEGRLTFKFTDERVMAAVTKAMGGDCYFDLYANDGPKAPAPRGEEEADDDF